MKTEIKQFIDNCSNQDKDDIYRYLWSDHIREDVRSRLNEDENISDAHSDDIVEMVVEAYVYNGDYDCDLSYWSNIETLISQAKESLFTNNNCKEKEDTI